MLGSIARSTLSPSFPAGALYGDVVKGLPEPAGSVDLVYCSHVLEHLSLADFRAALEEVYRLLRPGGIFRGVLPDLEAEVQAYLADPSPEACSHFMERTMLGTARRPRGLTAWARAMLGNSQHLWMWDFKGLEHELSSAGFVHTRRAVLGDSHYSAFRSVEEPERWEGCLGFECGKPVR